MNSPIDSRALRAVMRHVPSPVTVVTLAGADGPRGVTIGSFASVSLDPPLVSFNVGIESSIHPHVAAADRFAIHVLHAGQVDVSRHFAQPDLASRSQFVDIAHTDFDGLPVLSDALAVLICRRYAVYPAGDHSLVLAEVEAILDPALDALPLLYYRQSYRIPGAEVRATSPV
ncbi:MAG: flavin reductase family protein [Rhodothermales bacterium]|nr:flavin reductase family protein [Rhodothermales bacterium]